MRQIRDDKESTPIKRKRGGAVKKAPPGYYTAQEAQKVLGLNASTFGYYVRQGKIKRYVPPLRKEGFYARKEIDKLATEWALFLHTGEEDQTETRLARPEDAPGVVRVLTVRGWKTATAEQRVSWYAVNPFIDYVVVADGDVKGYIHAVPYTPDTLEAMLSGKKRSWHVQPKDILPYEPGHTYDVYAGIATRTDIPNHTQRFGFRLISGFMTFLGDLSQQEIMIRRVYAASDQPDGMKLCEDLGFELLPRKEGDLFNRYCLDLETSKSLFARKYRAFSRRGRGIRKKPN